MGWFSQTRRRLTRRGAGAQSAGQLGLFQPPKTHKAGLVRPPDETVPSYGSRKKFERSAGATFALPAWGMALNSQVVATCGLHLTCDTAYWRSITRKRRSSNF